VGCCGAASLAPEFLALLMALGAGYMLAVAFTDVIPESVRIGGQNAFLLVLIGYFLVHLFEHILAPHFHFGEETHTEMMGHHRARTVLFGLGIHTFFDGVAIAAGIFGIDVVGDRNFCGGVSA